MGEVKYYHRRYRMPMVVVVKWRGNNTICGKVDDDKMCSRLKTKGRIIGFSIYDFFHLENFLI